MQGVRGGSAEAQPMHDNAVLVLSLKREGESRG